MKEIEFKITEKGVKTYVSLRQRKPVVTDIDVDDDVDTLIFGFHPDETNFEICNVNKIFPNVTKFFIMPNVEEIQISNNMFPNVRAVASFNTRYETCSMLVSHGFLLNSFCLREDEILYLNDIKHVADYALEGCYAADIKGNENVITFSLHGIDNSRYANEPFVDGIKRYKNIIIEIDENAQDVILHK